MSDSFKYLEAVTRTDIGRKRKNNEDSLIALPEYGVYCVADGMGGAQDGEVASQAVVDALEERFVAGSDSAYAVTAAASSKIVAMALNKASSWIEQRSQQRGIQGCGSTAVVMVFDKVMPGRAVILHAGDSRAYQFRNRKLSQITVDHSVAAEAGVADENDLPPMLRGVITRAVGLKPQVDTDQISVELLRDDIYMLCSDGLSRMLSDKKVAAIFKKYGGGDLQLLLDHLVDSALEAGGKDNISVILIRVVGPLPQGPTMPVSDETRRLETLKLGVTDEELQSSTTAVTGGESTGEHSAESGEDVVECVTPGGGSTENGRRTVTDNDPAAIPDATRGRKRLPIILCVALALAVLLIALFFAVDFFLQ